MHIYVVQFPETSEYRLCAHPGDSCAGSQSVSPGGAGPAEQGRRRGRGERGDQPNILFLKCASLYSF